MISLIYAFASLAVPVGEVLQALLGRLVGHVQRRHAVEVLDLDVRLRVAEDGGRRLVGVADGVHEGGPALGILQIEIRFAVAERLRVGYFLFFLSSGYVLANFERPVLGWLAGW